MRRRDSLAVVSLTFLATAAVYACSDSSSSTPEPTPDAGGFDASTPDAAPGDAGDAGTCSGAFTSALAGGGAGQGDAVHGVALDKEGNVWVTGTFIGDAKWGDATLSSADKTHATGFVAKVDPSGKVLFAHALGQGGIANDAARVRVDGKGGAYVAGTFTDKLDLDGVHLVQNNGGGGGAAFVLALDATGKAVWGAATANNGGSSETGNDVAVDANGDVYLTGSYNGLAVFGTVTLPPGTSTTSDQAPFVAKYSPTKKDWVWAKGWAGPDTNSGGVGYGVSVTPDGKTVYAAGQIAIDIAIEGRLFNADKGSWLAKLDATDGHALWATEIAPPDAQSVAKPHAVASDAAGNLYVTGEFQGTAQLEAAADDVDGGNDAGTNGTSVTASGTTDMFLAQYDADGKPTWAKHAGGGQITRGSDVAFDGKDGLYVAGFKQGTISFDGKTLDATGDAFVVRYSTAGDVGWTIANESTTEANGDAQAVSVATSGVVAGGSFVATTTFGATKLTSAGQDDGFVTRICN